MTEIVVVLATTGLDRETQVVRALMARGSGFRIHRRACDVVELSSFGAAASGDVVAVSPRFPRLTLDMVQNLVRSGTTVVAVVDKGDDAAERVAMQWGLRVALIDDSSNCATLLRQQMRESTVPGTDAGDDRDDGRLVAVCGPAGSTGRSIVALNVAAELRGSRLLVDANLDTSSIAFQIGIPDDPSSLIAMCAQAERGVLDVARLRHACAEVLPDFFVCTGIGRVERRREVRAGGLDGMLRVSRAAMTTTVVDCGAGAQADVHVGILAAADQVLVTASPTALGIRRLADWLRDQDLPADRTMIVWNGLRTDGALGRNPLKRLTRGVRVGGEHPVVGLPWDERAGAAMDRRPGPLLTVAPHSRLRAAMTGLTARLA